jgi:hypothetical protein
MRQFTEEEILMAEKAEEIQDSIYEYYESGIIRDIHGYLAVGDYIAEWGENWEKIDDDTKKKKLVGKVQILKEEDADCYMGNTPYFSWQRKIWLPLEHQLWEMLGEFPTTLEKLYGEIWTEDYGLGVPAWASKGKHSADWQFTSFWQLLLAFVMHELYGKIWNGRDWVTVKN